jgi:hypothetical protein
MWDDNGVLHARSKGAPQHSDEGNFATKGMFKPAIDHLLTLGPVPGFVFRAETLATPKHNTLKYDSVPAGHLVLFDVESLDGGEFHPYRIVDYAGIFGVTAVRPIDLPKPFDLDALRELVQTESQLGGPAMEGIVLKNYTQGDPIRLKYPLMGKYVREEFKEKHKRSWKKTNPGFQDTVDSIIASLDTPQRYEKAVQHLRDDGRLTGELKDIGPLMKEVKRDVVDEEREWIADELMKFVVPKVERGVGRGLPQWYKDKLAEGQFE